MNFSAKVAIPFLMLVGSLSAHAQGTPQKNSTGLEVELYWTPMQNSAPDTVINQKVISKIIEEDLLRQGKRINFVQKSSDFGFIRIRMTYLYIPGSQTRVLTGVAGTMIQGGREDCSVDLNAWGQGSGGGVNEIKGEVKTWMTALNKTCGL